MTFLRARIAAALTMTVAAAVASVSALLRRGLVRFWCPGAAARPRDRHTRAYGSE